MRGLLRSFALLLAGFVSIGQAIDFELKELVIKDLDGDKTDYYFSNGDNRVFFRPPPRWTWAGSANHFEASPPPPRSGRLIIQTMPPSAEVGLPGDPSKVEDFKRLALASLSGGAESPTVLDVAVGQLGGAEVPCTRVTIDYLRNVQKRTVTVCFARFRPEQWLLFVVDAAKEDYASSGGEAWRSVEGFTEVKPPPKDAKAE
jgi:hypothetical protein